MSDSAPGQPIFGSVLRAACRIFLVLAAVGLTASLVVHVLAWAGVHVAGAMSLHVALFVVWIPTVLVSTRLTREHPQKDFWKAALRWCPRWASRGTMFLFGYAFVNFALSVLFSRARDHATSDADNARMFSAVWMVFYGSATAILYSAVHAVDDRRRCPSGHVASADATFWEKCGAPVPSVTPGAPPRPLVR